MNLSKISTLLFCVLLLAPATLWASEEGEKNSGERKIYTVIEFESTFMNHKKEKVLKILGEPDLKWELNEREVWKYYQIIKDQGKLWTQNIMFDFGRVNHMWGEKPVTGQ